MKKRILSCLLMMCMLVTMLPMTALAASSGGIGGIDGDGNLPGDPDENTLIEEFSPLAENIKQQTVKNGTPKEALDLPARLKVKFLKSGSNSAVYWTEWVSRPEYDPNQAGDYIFSPQWTKVNFKFRDGITFPTITVTVQAPVPPKEYTVDTWDALKQATEDTTSENKIITVTQDLVADSQITIPEEHSVTLKAAADVAELPVIKTPMISYFLSVKGSLQVENLVFQGTGTESCTTTLISVSGTLEMTNVTIENHGAPKKQGDSDWYGQKINGSSGCKITLTNCTVRDNFTGRDGTIKCSYGTLTLDNCVLQNNTVESPGGGGGAIQASGSTVVITDSRIEDNGIHSTDQRTVYGGGVYLDDSTATITGTTIQNNKAMRGAGIYSWQSDLTVDHCKILNNDGTHGDTDNYPWFNGGGICQAGGNLEIRNTEITGNSSRYTGGGIYIDGTDVTLDDTVKISGNQAVCGGGIYFSGADNTLNLNGTIVKDNEALKNDRFNSTKYAIYNGCGAGIANDGGNIVIKNAQISGNIADVCGGAIMNAGTLELKDGKISGNEASVQGGAIINHDTLTMTGGEITNNKATGTTETNDEGIGGGVANLATFTMTGGKLYDNTAARGGNDFYNYAEKPAGGDVGVGTNDEWENNHEMGLESLLPESYAAQNPDHGTFTLRPAKDFGFEGWFEDAPDKRYPENKTIYTPKTGDTDEKYLTIGEATVQTVTVTFQRGDHGSLNGTTSYPMSAGSVFGDDGRAVPTVNANSNYEFTGWLGSDSKIYTNSEILALTIAGNMTFTAQYKAVSSGGGGSTGGGSSSVDTHYTLRYKSNGGTEYKDERYSKNTVVKLNKVPTREGYTFTGWYADKGLTDRITSIKMTSDKTVYAGWEPTGVPEWLNGKDHFAYVMGYADGTVRPLNKISRAEVATIFFRLLNEDIREENLTTANTFDDVNEGMWCNTAISTMTRLGVVHGRTADRFDPNAPITRAEFAAICARFDASKHDGDSNFTDIAGHWAETEIERAASLGWVRGYTDGTFRPGNHITRAEAMTMINRVLNRLPEDEEDLLEGMNVWPDNQPSDWHYLAVQEATNSHDFTRKSDAVHEHWTKLTADPDWSRYQ